MKKNLTIGIVITAIIFLLALPKLKLWQNSKKEAPSSSSSGGQRGGKLSVETLIIHPSQLDNKLTVTGSVLANESLELKSEGSGKIMGLYFKEGNQVKKNELLLQINDEEIRAQLQKQKYNKKAEPKKCEVIV